MGHIVKDCRDCLHLYGETDTIDDSLLQYGDWLRAVPLKQPAKHLNVPSTGGRQFARRNSNGDPTGRGILGSSPFARVYVTCKVPIGNKDPEHNLGNSILSKDAGSFCQGEISRSAIFRKDFENKMDEAQVTE